MCRNINLNIHIAVSKIITNVRVKIFSFSIEFYSGVSPVNYLQVGSICTGYIDI